MSAILLADQWMPPELRLEDHLNSLGYQVTSVSEAELVNMVKMHPFDMIIWSVGSLGDSEKKIFDELRLFSDVPVLGIRMKGISEPEADDEKKWLDTVIEVPVDSEKLKECMIYYLREAYRRSHDMRLYRYKNLKISNGSIKKAEINQRALDLTVKEYMILSLLMCHRNRIYTKASLYEAVWRQPYTGDDNAVKIHISNLRSKLKKADPKTRYIETVWGQGYRMGAVAKEDE